MKYIPENVIFIGIPKTKEAKNHNNKLIYVYIADSDKKQQIESAKNKVSKSTNQDVVFCYDNEPMSGLTIDSFSDDFSKQTFLVYNKDNFCFDVDRSEILECMLKYGVQKGGILGGEWIIGRGHGTSYVLLVGGEKHKEFVHGTELEKITKKLNKSEIVPGFIYKNKRNSAWWYAGDYIDHENKLISSFISFSFYSKKLYVYGDWGAAPKTLYIKEEITPELKKQMLKEMLIRIDNDITSFTNQILSLTSQLTSQSTSQLTYTSNQSSYFGYSLKNTEENIKYYQNVLNKNTVLKKFIESL